MTAHSKAIRAPPVKSAAPAGGDESGDAYKPGGFTDDPSHVSRESRDAAVVLPTLPGAPVASAGGTGGGRGAGGAAAGAGVRGSAGDGGQRLPKSQIPRRYHRRAHRRHGGEEEEEKKHEDAAPDVKQRIIENLKKRNAALRAQLHASESAPTLPSSASGVSGARGPGGGGGGGGGGGSEKSALLEKLRARERQLGALKKKLADAKKANERMQSDGMVSSFAERVALLENQRREKGVEVQLLHEENRSLKNVQRAMSKRLDQYGKEQSHWPKRLASAQQDLQVLRLKLKKLQAKEASAEAARKAQHANMMALVERNRRLHQDLAEYAKPKRNPEGREAHKRLAELEEEKRELKWRLSKLEREKGSGPEKDKVQNLRRAQAQVRRLQTQLDDALATMLEKEKEARLQNMQLQKLRKRLKEALAMPPAKRGGGGGGDAGSGAGPTDDVSLESEYGYAFGQGSSANDLAVPRSRSSRNLGAAAEVVTMPTSGAGAGRPGRQSRPPVHRKPQAPAAPRGRQPHPRSGRAKGAPSAEARGKAQAQSRSRSRSRSRSKPRAQQKAAAAAAAAASAAPDLDDSVGADVATASSPARASVPPSVEDPAVVVSPPVAVAVAALPTAPPTDVGEDSVDTYTTDEYEDDFD